MNTDSVPEKIREQVEQFSAKWRDAAGLEEETLLRLAILREIVREVHAEKSGLLARGGRADAQALKEWEVRLDEIRGAAAFNDDLAQVISDRTPLRRRTRLLPEPLFQFIEKEKLERYDRSWEAALAAEASSLGWRFWTIDAWVAIAQAEVWHRALSAKLNPHGLVLFAESAPESPQGARSVAAGSEHWRGRWFILLKPRFVTPDFRLGELEGSAPGLPGPEWKMLYSPKKR